MSEKSTGTDGEGDADRASAGSRDAKAADAKPSNEPDMSTRDMFRNLDPHMLSQMWVALKKEPTLVIWQSNRSIDRPLADAVQDELEHVRTPYERLWVWLNSDGGELDAAYQISRAIRRAGHEVIAVVPRWAKSATTLIALACHRIVMNPMAELGPLDAQVMVRRHHSRRYASTIDTHKAVEHLRMFAAESFVRFTEMCLDEFTVDEATAGQMAAGALGAMIQPIFAQVDPGEMGEHARLLQMAYEYGMRLMKGIYNKDKAKEILTNLISGYPAHSFVIDFDEAKELGLKVQLPTEQEALVLNRCSSFFASCALHHHDYVDLVTVPPPETTVTDVADQRSNSAESKGAESAPSPTPGSNAPAPNGPSKTPASASGHVKVTIPR